MDNSEVVTLNEICRVCLMKSENMKQLLDPCDEVIGLISKLSTILNSEIEISDTLPSFLCRNCEEKLKVSYEFNRMCHKSHQFILTCLSAPNANQKNTEIHKVIQCDNNACESSSNQESENSKPVQENENFFTEVCKKSRTKQVMKLTQYSLEDVNKAIQEMRQKYIGTRDCLYCSFSSKDSRSLSIHMTRLHWKYKDKWCSKCNQTEQNLSQHVQNEHKDDFKCPFCGKETSNTSHFMEHLASHTVEREFVCNECDKRFISVRHLKAHSKVHNTAEEYCHICLVRVSDKELLSEHLTSRKKQRCNVCERIFDKNHYETHTCFISGDIQDTKIDNDQSVIDLHPASALRDQVICSKCNKVDNVEVRNYGNNEIEMKALCTFCGKQFRTRSKLSVHLRIHTGEAPYKCSYCDTRVATRSHLVVHERIHTGEKPHVCKVCGKGFAQASVLKTHTKIHTGRTEHCLLCPKKFCRPSELKQHMRKHTGEKPYPCTYCDKAFTQRSHLVEHSLTHSDIRPYTCEYCHKGFKKASTLKSHLNVHLENKSFKCTQCLYESQYSYLLNEHMIQHINSQPQTGKAHTCELCNESFTASDLLNLHCSTHHSTRDVKMNLVEVNEGEQFEILEQSLET